MITRRTVLVSGVAAGLSMGAAFPLDALSRGSASSDLPFDRVMFDGRFAAARLFGDEAAIRGMDAHDIQNDTGDGWYRTFRQRWQESDVAIAGLTPYSSYLSLRMMADIGRIRPQYVGYHHLETGVRHEMFGPQSVISAFRLDASSEHWPRAVARLLQTWSFDIRPDAPGRSSLGSAAERPVGARSLVSWILASRRR